MLAKKYWATAAIFAAVFALFTMPAALAAKNYVEAEGTYTAFAAFNETAENAFLRAAENAKRIAEKNAAAIVKNNFFPDEEIADDTLIAATAQILQIFGEKQIIKKIDEQNTKYSVILRGKIDKKSGDILRELIANRKRAADLTRQYNEFLREYDKTNADGEIIKKRYESASPAEKIELKAQNVLNNMRFNAVGKFKTGNDFFIFGEYAKAAKAYTDAADNLNRSAQLYNNRGLCHYKLHRLDDAEKDFSRAVALNRRTTIAA